MRNLQHWPTTPKSSAARLHDFIIAFRVLPLTTPTRRTCGAHASTAAGHHQRAARGGLENRRRQVQISCGAGTIHASTACSTTVRGLGCCGCTHGLHLKLNSCGSCGLIAQIGDAKMTVSRTLNLSLVRLQARVRRSKQGAQRVWAFLCPHLTLFRDTCSPFTV